MSFEAALKRLRFIEGGYSNNLRDSGGATNHGITQRVARRHGYQGDMYDLPIDVATHIARREYWETLRLDEIDALSAELSFELFEQGYHMGPAIPALHLQRSLNVLNNEQKKYPDVEVDGALGPMTIAALKSYLVDRGKPGELVLLRCLNSLQCTRLILLAEARQKDETFVYGWLLQRVTIAS